MFTHDYLAATNARSLLEDQVIHDEDNNIEENILSEDENEDNDDMDYEKILEAKKTNLSSCIVIDNLDGAIRRCNSTMSLLSITQLIGTWEVLCPGLKLCSVFQRIPNIASRFTVQDRYVRFICTKCFEKYEDTNHILKLFSSWLFKLSYSSNKSKKKEVLQYIIKLLETPRSLSLYSSSSMNTKSCSPSLLLVKITIKINKFDNSSSTNKYLVKQLVDELTFAFYDLDPAQHDLFKHAQKMKHDDIYKTKEPVTKGRWVKELVNVSAKQYLLAKKD
ncbi:7290_t:CDS:2 [Cetraspora pellucida]|uniref:7290_t:CDS:1 n=1 Tax=Cetraspora pellucida TaxID=1433469 RepID=A0A9N9NSP1_9GLOM|nr:7290_t:CDS:2 [Cetraspora pellucida]